MSPQLRFQRWITLDLPFLKPLFDFENQAYLPEVLESYLATASHGQAIMARFAVGVWRGDNHHQFDAFEAARVLDQELCSQVTQWMNDPYWP